MIVHKFHIISNSINSQLIIWTSHLLQSILFKIHFAFIASILQPIVRFIFLIVMQVEVEMRSWPYSWPASPDYAKAQERGIFSGRLLVCDQ